ncbi:MAG TPA: sensor histidine kinase N-terminal domain-containing protein [Burkholderiaceae bacterium]|nr:sensor histidine kinase N-terminal domain-containing protein [Burkholderiaceae bacterium]
MPRARAPRFANLRPRSGPFSRPSIRRSLVVWLIIPLAILIPATAVLFYRLALAPALDSLDRSLDGSALALERLVQVDDGVATLRVDRDVDIALRADRFDTVYWVVLGPHGRVLGGDAALAGVGGPSSGRHWQFADAQFQGDPVRVAMHAWPCIDADPISEDARCESRVAETLNKGHGVESAVLTAATSAMVLEALVLAAMGWVAIARSLRKVESLSKDIENRSPNHLGPVDRPDIPREVAPLVSALNGLFARVTAASAAEKAFIADAAHQLRTPLTALRTETELALLETHPPQLEGLLRRLHAGTTRAARLAHQLLAQARAEHDLNNTSAERFDLKQIASEAAEDWVARSVESGVDLGFELEAAPLDGHGFLLRELLANLLDNALNYAGAGARITVRTSMMQDPGARLPPRAVLEVEDSGPGIPQEDRERVFERFQRCSNDGPGSGLGLSIVRDIARHHRARVQLLDGPGGVGLNVRVTFMPPDMPRRTARRGLAGEDA